MKNIHKKTAVLLGLILGLLLFTLSAFAVTAATIENSAADDPTYTTAFPDTNFRTRVLAILNADGTTRTGDSLVIGADKTALAAVEDLNVGYGNIADLTGIEYFTGLKALRCHANNLTTLDISKNTALEIIGASANQLKALDVSQHLALKELNCASNQIEELDVSKNTALTYLACFYNSPLKALDVSKNPELVTLISGDNQITKLDVTQNPKLELLECWNLLTELDLTKNPALVRLHIGSAKLTKIDLSQNTKLKEFICTDNELTALDLSKNPELTMLWCGVNNLVELDLSHNAKLLDLNCRDNLLTKLTLAGADALVEMLSDRNPLKTLDVSKNTELMYLYCRDDQLTELDVSKNTKLVNFFCTGNQLTKLDVSNSPNLDWLFCYDNQLTGLDMTKNTKLSRLYCYNNYMESPAAVKGVENLLINSVENRDSGAFRYHPQFLVIVDPLIIITVQPAAHTTVTQGQIKASLNIKASISDGSGTPTYQWYANTTASNTGGVLIPGATQPEFAIPIGLTAAASPYYYYCVLGGAMENVVSEVAMVTVLQGDGAAYNFRLYLEAAQASLKVGDTLLVDIMLSGDINYTQVNTAIAYDAGLLEFAGYGNISGLVAEVKKTADNNINVRSVPVLNMIAGAPCTPPVRVVTLKFTVKNNFAANSIATNIAFASIGVTPTAGVTGITTAPGNTLNITLNK